MNDSISTSGTMNSGGLMNGMTTAISELTTSIFDLTSAVTTEPYSDTGSTTNGTFGADDLTTVLPDTVTGLPTTTHLYDTYNVFIHPHWKQFPAVSSGWHYFIGVYITIVGITGVCGNALVIYMFSRVKPLRTPSNMFLVNLAISDMTFSIVNGFPLLSLSAFNKRWLFGQAACEFYGLIGGIFGLMSINTMATIALDRYFAIARPLQVAKNMTRKRSFLMIVVVWIWSFVSCLPPVFGWGRYIPEGFQTSCTFDYLTRSQNNRSYILFMYSFGFAVPLGFIIICYAMILKAINRHEKEMKKTAKKLNAEMRTNQDKQRMEIRVAKIAMSILVLYLLSWLPYATIALIAQFGDASFVTPFWSEFPVMAAKASAMHNPIVYALSHPKFREAINERMPWLMCCCKPKTSPTSKTSASTYKERNTSKRSVSSVTGGMSIDSDVSHLDDNMDIKMRTMEQNRQLQSERMSRFRKERDVSREMEEIPAGQIIQDLTKALVELSARNTQNNQAARPIHLPSSILQNISAPVLEGATAETPTDEKVFVIDSSTLPALASYLAKLSIGNSQATGNINPGFDMSQEMDERERESDKGAKPKLKQSIKPDVPSIELQSDEEQL